VDETEELDPIEELDPTGVVEMLEDELEIAAKFFTAEIIF